MRGGMCGLPQVRLLAHQFPEQILKKKGYAQSRFTPGFWKHKWRPILFTLMVDDFGVKCVGKQHTKHLIEFLKENYEISEDWEGSEY